jgi:uncharacterized membrane protein
MEENNVAVSLIASRIRSIAYWVATVIIVLESAAGSEWDLTHNQYVKDVFTHLGYPLYLLTILGVWKLLAAIVLIIPRFPKVKEWAYAGLFFAYSGGAISQLAIGSSGDAWGPFIFAGITVASWFLRPPSRCLTIQSEQPEEKTKEKKWRLIIYWVATGLLALGMLQSGIFAALRTKQWIDLVTALGYPVYFLTILGVWKILGVIAILVPGFKLVKEWAYAGFFFAMTGALASHLACSDYSIKGIIGPLFQTAFIIFSWYFRPANRKIISVE